MARTIQALERAIRVRQSDLTPQYAEFERGFAHLVDALLPWLEDAGEDGGFETPMLDESATLAALSEALGRGDLAALRLFESLRPTLLERVDAPALLPLEEAIRALRFDDALALLNRFP